MIKQIRDSPNKVTSNVHKELHGMIHCTFIKQHITNSCYMKLLTEKWE